MIRRYLPAIVSTSLLITLGIGIELLWWGVTGRMDMPWWLAILLAAGAAWISDLAEQTLRAARHRGHQAEPEPARHWRPVSR